MQRLRGEITVFLSLILVCVFSLMMGLLESARTAGARLYLQMAADSALFSVMSQYNRNLWDRYRLLFLEYEAEEDLLASFEQYLGFYLEQDQFYPARLEAAEITELVKAGDAGGAFLEQEILSYIQYRLPEVAGNLAGIAKEAEEAAKAGIMAGYEAVDFKVRLVDGSTHEVDSSEMAFRVAGSMAFRSAAEKAGPILLEPIMKVEIDVPDEYVGDVMSNLNSRRGSVRGMEMKNGVQAIESDVPLSEMFGYATTLRSITQGRATFTMLFDHYAEVPQSIAEKVTGKKFQR